MTYYIVKVAITTALVVLISEISKRSSLAGAVLTSVPLVSVLAMIWLYVETRDAGQVAPFSRRVFWLVPPSLGLFLLLAVLLDRGLAFYLSLAAAIAVTIAAYYVTIALVRHFGIQA
jgi:hypothetical protein